jgi:hypothetical protein
MVRLTLAVLLLSFGASALACDRPPVADLAAARSALAAAAASDGVHRAPDACAEAHADLARAEAEMRVQEKRPRWSRRYREADALAALALESGRSCAARARAVQEIWKRRAATALETLDTAVQRAAALQRHADDDTVQSDLLRATLGLKEGRALFAEGDYERAVGAAGRGADRVKGAVRGISASIAAYRESPRMPSWRRWVRETLDDTKESGRVVLLVDKLRRQLLVLRGDDELASYTVDLGTGGMEHKTRAGDASTPEGRYHITEVRAPGQTHWHRALMLDYPNEEDKRRFRALQHDGVVSRAGRIGSNIEIHGEGGRDQDWTQGCVALSNDDIDALVEWVKVGTPVTIVGLIPDGEYE